MKRTTVRSDRSNTSDGFIVVAVLWILSALAMLATIYAIYVANSVTAARIHDDRIQGQALFAAALDLAVYQLYAVSEDKRPMHGVFNFRLGGAQVAADFTSETARIDLNTAPKELLAGLFVALGARPADAGDYADRIAGWRSPAVEDGKEAEAYRVAGLAYGPRGAPFAHAGELWLVLGLPQQLVARAMAYVTVFSGKAGIDVLDAAPLIVAALPGMDPERLNAILNQRGAGGSDGQSILSLVGADARSMITAEPGKAFRVTVRADLEGGRRFVGTAVIMILIGEAEPFRVLSWNDSTDGSTLDELPRTAL